jgi:AcrR family transcriptional regulator
MAQVLKEDIKLSILDAARNVFVIEGFEASSMRQIAKGAGVTVGNLYRYFENKEAIYDAIIRDVIRAIDVVLVTGSEGKVSFYSEENETAPVDQRMEIGRRILEGLYNVFPTLLQKHKKDLMILLQSADKLRHHPNVFDLISWIGRNFEVVFNLNGTGDYVAIALIKGLEAILSENEDIGTTSVKLQTFMAYMTMRK